MRRQTLILNVVQTLGLAAIAAATWIAFGLAAGLAAAGLCAVVVGEGWGR